VHDLNFDNTVGYNQMSSNALSNKLRIKLVFLRHNQSILYHWLQVYCRLSIFIIFGNKLYDFERKLGRKKAIVLLLF